MARKTKSVYERIAELDAEIQATEERLTDLKRTLAETHSERENLEMHQLFDFIKQNNISFEEAKAMIAKTA